MKIIKRCLSISIIVALLACILMMSTVSSSASGTGAGLAEWALNAYNSKWSYVYGGATPGAVDCSGLIYSYAGGQCTTLTTPALYPAVCLESTVLVCGSLAT